MLVATATVLDLPRWDRRVAAVVPMRPMQLVRPSGASTAVGSGPVDGDSGGVTWSGTPAYGKKLADSLSDADLATLVYGLMADRNTRATAALAACFRGPND